MKLSLSAAATARNGSTTLIEYCRPILIEYGPVSRLTQAGSGLDIENGNPGNCSQNTNARPCR